ncbi:MAG: hypothetical protein JWQ97_506 [Phenylobacterium sp.]|nr:hypothetical protein [Phenylobacterium sp.]
MAMTTEDELYTLMGVREDGIAPVIGVVPARDRAVALAEAQSFLAEHRSCATVEVWKDNQLLAKVARPQPAPGEASPPAP